MELDVGGLRLHYRLEGSGPAVLLLHGLGSCGEDWVLQFPALTARYTVLAPDLRGHGQSARPRGTYTIDRMADDIAGLLTALNIESTHVVGLSLGGLVAQALALRERQQVRSLVLVNTFARLRPQGWRNWRYMLRRAWRLLNGGIQAQAQVIAEDLFPKPEQAHLRQIVVKRIIANDPRAYRAALWAAWRFDSRRDLGRIGVPTLVVAGLRDASVSLHAKQELADGISGARLVTVADSGHVTPIDQCELFNRLVLELFEQV